MIGMNVVRQFLSKDCSIRTPKSQQHQKVWAVSFYYHPNFSGAAIQAHRILKGVVRAGFQVTVFTAADNDARNLAGQKCQLDNVAIEYLPVVRRRAWAMFSAISLLRNGIRKLNQIACDISFNLEIALKLWRQGKKGDILQLYSLSNYTIFSIWAAKRKGMRIIMQLTLMGADDPMSFSRRRLRFLRHLKLSSLRNCDCVIGLSSALTESCLEAGIDERKVMRIPNGVDVALYDTRSSNHEQLQTRLGLATDRRYIIFVGAALMRKGIDVVVQSFIKMAKDLNDVNLLIVGEADFDDQSLYGTALRDVVLGLKEELRQAGLSSRVHWVGLVDNVHEYLQASDIFFFPTRREGLPNVVAEAMAAGLPILASHVEGVTTDLICSGTHGVLVSGYDPADYSQELLELLQDPKSMKSFGEAARDCIESEYQLDVITDRYIDIYKC